MGCTSKCLICTDVNVAENAVRVNILKILQYTPGCDYITKWDAGNEKVHLTLLYFYYMYFSNMNINLVTFKIVMEAVIIL